MCKGIIVWSRYKQMAADLKIFFYDLGKYNKKKINEISVTLFVISERKCINHIRTGKIIKSLMKFVIVFINQ